MTFVSSKAFKYSQCVEKSACRYGHFRFRATKKSNCWKTLKLVKPQRKDEICLSVKVAKAKKIN